MVIGPPDADTDGPRRMSIQALATRDAARRVAEESGMPRKAVTIGPSGFPATVWTAVTRLKSRIPKQTGWRRSIGESP